MTNQLPPREVQLYPQAPSSLIPLLQSHLPHSLPILGTIQTSDPSGYTIYTTFSTLPLTPANRPFVILTSHLPPNTSQARIFCSTESHPPTSDKEEEEAINLVVGCIWRLRDLLEEEQGKGGKGELSMVGGVSERWCGGIGRASGRDVGTGVGWCDIWYKPGSDSIGQGEGSRNGDGEGDGEGDDVKRDGLMVDHGIEVDAELIQKTRDIHQPLEYYISRLSQTTVVRPITHTDEPKEPAVAWIMSSASGDLSSLFVVEEYRRKGLAKWVIHERLKHIREEGQGGSVGGAYVWVVRGNKGSESLFTALGWVKGWGVKWCHIEKGLGHNTLTGHDSLAWLQVKLKALEAREQVVSEDVK